ncbi:MAG: tRNA 2-thiocytidine biosynthesis protein TtcA [Eubacterium sp.]|nr:tRNA 2-thiocytidine biosynthesis protein TtcA [Eubacterium sp.]
MQKIMGYLRKACQQYDMIQDGDKIAVAVSGGKDSLVLLTALSQMRRFYPKKYEVAAITIDPSFNNKQGNFDSAARICEGLGVEYKIVRTEIAKIVFDIRKEPNPCSLCANLRRGALYNAAAETGCNKLALGHNNDDVIETFLMNIFKEGRVGCFSPVTRIEDKNITVIRPMVLAPEAQVISACRRGGITPIASLCPVDKHTTRQHIKDFINNTEREDRGFKLRLFTALRKSNTDGWS